MSEKLLLFKGLQKNEPTAQINKRVNLYLGIWVEKAYVVSPPPGTENDMEAYENNIHSPIAFSEYRSQTKDFPKEIRAAGEMMAFLQKYMTEVDICLPPKHKRGVHEQCS